MDRNRCGQIETEYHGRLYDLKKSWWRFRYHEWVFGLVDRYQKGPPKLNQLLNIIV